MPIPLAAACMIVCLAVVVPARAQVGTDLSAGLVATLEHYRARYGFPGVTAAIALPGGRVATAATGLADVEFGRGMTPETPMLAASVGKTFVAATVMALESEGRLWQADLLADHLGDRIAAGDGAVSPEDLVGFVIGREPLFEAGTGWAYSDTGYVLLGLVIEALANPYLDRMLAGAPVAPDAPGILYGAGVAIYADTPRGPVYGHGGWIPGYVSSLRHYADHGLTVAFQINTDAGFLDETSDLVPALEGALADLVIGAGR